MKLARPCCSPIHTHPGLLLPSCTPRMPTQILFYPAPPCCMPTQVLSLCMAPFLLDHPDVGKMFPPDAISRARLLLGAFKGGVGAYSDSRGNLMVGTLHAGREAHCYGPYACRKGG